MLFSFTVYEKNIESPKIFFENFSNRQELNGFITIFFSGDTNIKKVIIKSFKSEKENLDIVEAFNEKKNFMEESSDYWNDIL